MTRLGWWVLLRGPVCVTLLVLVHRPLLDALTVWLVTDGAVSGTAHAWAKDGLGIVHNFLLFHRLWLGMIPVFAVLGVLSLRPGLAVSAWAGVGLVGVLGGAHPGVVCAVVLLGWANLALRRVSRLAWLPVSGLVFPIPTVLAVGKPWLLAFALWPTLLGWAMADSAVRARLEPQRSLAWPRHLEAASLQRLATAAPGVRCEFHDAELGDTRLVVTAEEQTRLLAFDLQLRPIGEIDQPPWWGPVYGVAMDSVFIGDVSWYLCGFHELCEARWAGAGSVRSHRVFSRPLDHVYTRRLPSGDLALFNVNVQASRAPALVSVVNPASPTNARQFMLVDAQRRPLPTIREVEWLPTLQQFVVAPDFGDQLYLVNPTTWESAPWLRIPSMNGKLYPTADGKLYIAQPNAFAVTEVDVTSGAIRYIPTQPGVRALAVADGRLLTASVLTGQVWVQDLDGALVDTMGTVMPMVREITIVPGRRAVLSTWTVLYAFSY